MKNRRIKVLCVDDNDLVAEGLRIKLSLAGDFQWLGALCSADNLINEVWRQHPDVVLLDVDMPGRDPFSALEQIRELFPNVHVLMISGHVRPELIDRAIESGAWGYVSKHHGADTIVHAIARVAEGQFALGPDVQQIYRDR